MFLLATSYPRDKFNYDIDIHYHFIFKKNSTTTTSGFPLSLFFCTAGTQAKYVQFVAFLDIAIFFYKFILNLFELMIINLFEPAAPEADQMVVMFMAVLVFKTL